MIIIALGANVRGRAGSPIAALVRAGEWLNGGPARLAAFSSIWRSAPFGPIAQPSFFNAAAVVETDLGPAALLAFLKQLEARAGRRRGPAWGPRALDLDLIDYNGEIRRPPGMGGKAAGLAAHAAQMRGLVLPHPGIAERAFVLKPLEEIAPGWRHPVTGQGASQMLARLPGKVKTQCRLVSECPSQLCHPLRND